MVAQGNWLGGLSLYKVSCVAQGNWLGGLSLYKVSFVAQGNGLSGLSLYKVSRLHKVTGSVDCLSIRSHGCTK